MTASHSERLARAALTRAGEPGDPRIAAMLAHAGAAETVGYLRTRSPVDEWGEAITSRLLAADPVADLEAARRRGVRFVVPGDAEWPGRLDDLAVAEGVADRTGPPVGLWVRGPLDLVEATRRSVAVVGARSCTTYGAQVAGDVSADLGEEGWGIVSGAAFGIDRAAHLGALTAQAPTVAVLACGPDRVYPQAHASLIEQIGQRGLVVTEAPWGSSVTKLRFLSRNRIIAALTGGTLVVEAALRSGALNTANWARQLHRPVLGVPGPVSSAASAGVHELIRSQGAGLVTRAAEVLEVLGAMGETALEQQRGPDGPEDALGVLDRQVLDAVPVSRPVSSARLARTAGVGAARTRAALEVLRMAGLVEQVEDRGWRLAAPAVAAR